MLACKLLRKGEFSKIPPDIMMRYYGNINRLYKDFCPIVHSPALRGIYIYGKSGIGKITLARALFPGEPIYYKNHNKWFDGYQSETVIIWDDLGLDHPKMFSNYFKIWTDRHGCRGEVKGGLVSLTHKYFIFTSQYSMETMFPDPETYDAMSRRCFDFHMAYYEELDVRTVLNVKEMLQFLSGQKEPEVERHLNRGDA